MKHSGWRGLKHNLKHAYRMLLLVTAICCILPPTLMVYVAEATHAYRYTHVESVPNKPVAIVFGAGVLPDGRLSPMLAHRVDAAIALYHAGKVRKLLMTGDNSRVEYNEVAAMKRYAMQHDVPSRDIKLDYAGFRTYDSCYRAHAIFDITDAVLVTQRYHLPRAVYTCRHLGIDALGLGTPDWDIYPSTLMRRYVMREVLATLKALEEVHITRPKPRFLGPKEPFFT